MPSLMPSLVDVSDFVRTNVIPKIRSFDAILLLPKRPICAYALLQLAPLTRKSPTITSSVLSRLLSSGARAQIQKAIDASPVVLFMNGTPELPQCGFFRTVIQVLDVHGVPADMPR